MTRWRITSEGEEQPSGGYDGIVWLWGVESAPDREQVHAVNVKLSGSAFSSGADTLPPRVAVARETRGANEIERVLDWPEPPGSILLHTLSLEPTYLLFTELTDQGAWACQVFKDGELHDMAVAATTTDALLAVIDRLLPPGTE
jgi:hypothetical protein